MTHLIEVAGLILAVPFIRFIIVLTIIVIVMDGRTDRKTSC